MDCRSFRVSLVVLVALIALLSALWAPAALPAPRLQEAPPGPEAGRDWGVSRSGILPAPRDFANLAGTQISPMLFAAPASYDLRDQGKLTPVKDQGQYGTCWTFATFASLESCLLPGETWDFSEDNLAWFHGFDTDGYNGGQYLQSAAYLLRWRGPFTEQQDAYADGAHPDPSSLDMQKHVQDVMFLPPRTSWSDMTTSSGR